VTRVCRKDWKELHLAIGEMLLREWDPIGVSDIPEASDEYDSYIPQIHGLMVKGASPKEVFEYLWWVETKNMGVAR